MKTAVSIPAELFEAAEQQARHLGLSRSALYARALRQFLQEDAQADVTRRLNEVCEQVDTSLDPRWKGLQARALLGS